MLLKLVITVLSFKMSPSDDMTKPLGTVHEIVSEGKYGSLPRKDRRRKEGRPL